ncbi:family 10 glycosylhydrolase (plasmid) [Pedobacter sp. BS3]|uniref:glycoside hydrolase family 10 protein n=1 Tax=Pedobacter sp. BS3 TaxID=2567937 RepID=UPI0011EBCEC8|nr:family 10 glycosylhydrolase [Pedobacter sp. BS3]TZF85909.1 family 10 glycosylhydrolase [Pedobacter sp. BS3]
MRLLFLLTGLLTCFSNHILSQPQPSEPPKHEFRGVWIATVANIDWPSKPGLTTEAQKEELIRILDTHQRTGINAIMFQVRPAADAFYSKSEEPWSRYLSGKQGGAPDPFYDPLEFALTEAHKRGMELHAWFNPYRATMDMNPQNTREDHITKTHPGWFFSYGGKKLFNPGIPEVRSYIVRIIMNVVRNYDIDGVHFDDYFYPYPESRQLLPDTDTYRLYGADFDDIDDWRRHNVDTLIHQLSDSIHAAKHYLKFGISPFGIWRNSKRDPEGSETNGLEAYSALYADARKWIKEGWIDYINPQIYFPFGYAAAPYEKLVDWWSNNTYNKHLYIGQGVYRVTENREGWRDKSQIPRQIRYLRNNPRVQGSVFFSSKSLTSNLAGIRDSLQYDLYRYKALQPPMLWLDNTPPLEPMELTAKTIANNKVLLNWKTPLRSRDGETAYGYVIYRFNEGEEVNIENSRNILTISFDGKQTSYTDDGVRKNVRYTYAVTALDRLKNESGPSNLVVVKIN